MGMALVLGAGSEHGFAEGEQLGRGNRIARTHALILARRRAGREQTLEPCSIDGRLVLVQRLQLHRDFGKRLDQLLARHLFNTMADSVFGSIGNQFRHALILARCGAGREHGLAEGGHFRNNSACRLSGLIFLRGRPGFLVCGTTSIDCLPAETVRLSPFTIRPIWVGLAPYISAN